MQYRLTLFWLLTSPLLLSSCENLGKRRYYLDEAEISIQQVFESERFPNAVVTPKGTVVLSWGSSNIRVRRSENGGLTFGSPIAVGESGIQGGGMLVDATSGAILQFIEDHHPPAELQVFRSEDDGRTWTQEPVELQPNSRGHLASMHMNESGITLEHGEHAGRLVRPTRYYAGGNHHSEWPNHYTNAMYSDDGGKTWQVSEPYPEMGMGEAAIVELSDGSLYYNSRVHWPEAQRPTRRREARSFDGGATWEQAKIIEVLPDGRQDRAYGCMGGLARLPIQDHDVLLYSNLDTSNPTRERVTVWGSFDGGATWPVKRLVYDGPSGYSSLASGVNASPSQGWIYLLFEGGPSGGCSLARFNLSWLLAGEPTGDGEVPPDFKLQ